MKLTRKKIRNIILQEMSNWSYKTGANGRPRNLKRTGQNDGSWEAGEYIETPERQEAERIKKLQAELNAKGMEQIQDAIEYLGLFGKWIPHFKQKMNQHGWITDYSAEDQTVTFEGKSGRPFIWYLNDEDDIRSPVDYEGRN